MTEREVWYFLVNGTGQLLEGTSADKVRVSRTGDIADFRDAVHAKNSTKLSHCDPSGLVVNANKAAFDRKDDPLQPENDIGNYGTKESKLYVIVPATREPKSSLRTIFENFGIECTTRDINHILKL